MLHTASPPTQQPNPTPLFAYAGSVKPFLDAAIALLALTLLTPLFAAIAVIIYCDSGGPVLFRQRRIGKQYRPFTIIKFRSMSAGKVTAAGKVLRQTGLDELPQLWNILRGDMSWVGPRPLTEDDIHRLGWQQPYYRRRWHIKPGITGLAQLYGGVGRKVTWLCDQHYVGNLGLQTDIKILAASLMICIAGKRFVRRQLYQLRNSSRFT